VKTQNGVHVFDRHVGAIYDDCLVVEKISDLGYRISDLDEIATRRS